MTSHGPAPETLLVELETLLDDGRVAEASRRLRSVDALLSTRSLPRDERIWLLNVAARVEIELGSRNARHRLQAALRLSRLSQDPALRGVCLLNLGAEAAIHGEIEVAARHWLKALEHFSAHQDYGRYSQALLNLLGILTQTRRFEAVDAMLKKLLPMLQGAHDPWGRFGVYLALGQLEAARGNPSAAAEAFRSALRAAHRTGEASRVATALQNLGSSYFDQGRPKLAARTYRRALQSAASKSATRFRATLLRSMALALLHQRDYKGAETALQESRHIGIRVHDRHIWADATSDLGGLRIAEKRWAAARGYLNRSLATYRKLNRARDIARALSNLAALDEALQRLEDAARGLLSSADAMPGESDDRSRLLEQAGDMWLSADRQAEAVSAYLRSIDERRPSDIRGDAWSYLISATKLANGSDSQQALPFYTEAIERYRQLRDPQLRFHSLNDRALCHARLGDIASAAVDLRLALSIGRRQSDRAMIAQGSMNLGEVLRRAGKMGRATYLLRKAAATAREVGDSSIEASAMGNLGLALLYSNRTDEAERALAYAHSIAASIGESDTVALAEGGMGGVSMDRSDFATAIRWYSAAITIERRLALQPQLTESLAAICEALAATRGARRAFRRRFQQLIDISQETGLEAISASGALRSARWYLHRAETPFAAGAVAVALALSASRADEQTGPDSLGRTLLEASFYWLLHVPERRGEFVPRVTAALDEIHRGLGKAFRPLLRAALEQAGSIPMGSARRDWAKRAAKNET